MVKRRISTFETGEELLPGFKCIALGEGVGLRCAKPTYGTENIAST